MSMGDYDVNERVINQRRLIIDANERYRKIAHRGPIGAGTTIIDIPLLVEVVQPVAVTPDKRTSSSLYRTSASPFVLEP